MQLLSRAVHLFFQVADHAQPLTTWQRSQRRHAAWLVPLDLVGDLLLAHCQLQPLRQVAHALDDAAWLDAVGLVVKLLLDAPSFGLLQCAPHAVGDLVGVEDRLALDVARCTSYRLDKRLLGTEKAFLVGVQHCHQADLGQVQPLAQQVDADDHIVHAQPQIAQYLDPLQRVDVAVQIVDADVELGQIVSQILGHAFSQRGDQHPLAVAQSPIDLLDQIVHLAGDGTNLHHRVQQTGGPDHLIDDLRRHLALVGAGRGAGVDRLVEHRVELFETQRPVVHGQRQAEAEIDQHLLAHPVAVVHAADLRQRHVALVDDAQPVGREVIQQRPRL